MASDWGNVDCENGPLKFNFDVVHMCSNMRLKCESGPLIVMWYTHAVTWEWSVKVDHHDVVYIHMCSDMRLKCESGPLIVMWYTHAVTHAVTWEWSVKVDHHDVVYIHTCSAMRLKCESRPSWCGVHTHVQCHEAEMWKWTIVMWYTHALTWEWSVKVDHHGVVYIHVQWHEAEVWKWTITVRCAYACAVTWGWSVKVNHHSAVCIYMCSDMGMKCESGLVWCIMCSDMRLRCESGPSWCVAYIYTCAEACCFLCGPSYQSHVTITPSPCVL